MISRQVFAYTAPFACYILFLALRSQFDTPSGSTTAPAAFDARWLYGVQVAAVTALLLFCRKHYADLRVAPKLADLAWGLVCGVIVFVLWINLDASWMKMGEAVKGGVSGYAPLRADGSIDILMAAIRIAGAALVVPVMEELFWRSFLMRWMENREFATVDPKRIGWIPLLLVSLVFGLEHDLWFAGLIAGLAYGWLYMRTGNLWAPILAHAVTNAMLGAWVLLYARWEFW